MCMTPVSPDTTTRARASSAPVSWSENSPAALGTEFPPPPSATSCCASPRSSGPPTTTGRYPAVPSRSARALQCATGQRLVAWAAPGASAASRAPPPEPPPPEPPRPPVRRAGTQAELGGPAVGAGVEGGGGPEVAPGARRGAASAVGVPLRGDGRSARTSGVVSRMSPMELKRTKSTHNTLRNKSCVARLRQSPLALAYGAPEDHPLGG